jgi:hypothetical protein
VAASKAHSSTSLLSAARLHGKQEQKLEMVMHMKNGQGKKTREPAL